MTHIEIPGGSVRVPVGPPDLVDPPTYSDDGYPKIILDQRELLPNGKACQTSEDVLRDCWAPFLARKGMEPQPDDRTVTPYINQSRWLADCPECNGGIACWDRNPYGCCLDCGHVFKVVWQPPAERAEIIRLLAGRSMFCACHPNTPGAHINWDAHKGETRDELVVQNVLTLGVAPELRNGLLVSENVTLPDDLTNPQEYLDRLQTERRKKL